MLLANDITPLRIPVALYKELEQIISFYKNNEKEKAILLFIKILFNNQTQLKSYYKELSVLNKEDIISYLLKEKESIKEEYKIELLI